MALMQAGMGIAGGTGNQASQTPDWYRPPRSFIEMIHDRWVMATRALMAPHIHAIEGTYAPGDCPALCVHNPGKGKLFVFCATPNGAEIIEDEACIFPSDALLAKLRLLVNTQK